MLIIFSRINATNGTIFRNPIQKSGAFLAKVCYWPFSCSPTATTDQSVSSSNMWRGLRRPGSCFRKADVGAELLGWIGKMMTPFPDGKWWNYIVYSLVLLLKLLKLLVFRTGWREHKITHRYNKKSVWAGLTCWRSADRPKFRPMGKHGAWLVDHSHGCWAGAEMGLVDVEVIGIDIVS